MMITIVIFFFSLIIYVNNSCFDRTKTLPIPARALGPIASGAAYYVGKLSTETGTTEGVYWATNGAYNHLFVVYNSGIVVVDAPAGTDWSLQAVKSIDSTKPITHFIYSHTHTDHIGNAKLFNLNSAIYIAQERTAQYLRARYNEANSLQLPVPTITFCENYTLSVGNYKLELSYKNNAHVEGNTYIWLANQKVLMVIDLIFPRWCPYNRLGEMTNTTLYYQNIDQILSFNFTYLIGGHLGRTGDMADVNEARNFYTSLLYSAQKNLLAPDNYYSLAANGNTWNFLRSWYDDSACNCATDLITQWGGQLAAIDVYAETHCYLIQEAMRIETNPMTAANITSPVICSANIYSISFMFLTFVAILLI